MRTLPRLSLMLNPCVPLLVCPIPSHLTYGKEINWELIQQLRQLLDLLLARLPGLQVRLFLLPVVNPRRQLQVQPLAPLGLAARLRLR